MEVTASSEKSEIILSSLLFTQNITTGSRRQVVFEWQQNLEPNTIDKAVVDSLSLFCCYTALFITNVACIKAYFKTKLYAVYSSLLGRYTTLNDTYLPVWWISDSNYLPDDPEDASLR